jgi:hypothetical protein
MALEQNSKRELARVSQTPSPELQTLWSFESYNTTF